MAFWIPLLKALPAIIGAASSVFNSASGATAAQHQRRAGLAGLMFVQREQAVARRDLVRNMRLARAQALAQGSADSGGLRSSGVGGTVGSLGSQGEFNLDYFQGQASLAEQKHRSEIAAGNAISAGTNLQNFAQTFQAGVNLWDSWKNYRASTGATTVPTTPSATAAPKSVLGPFS
jgi:hypothetical protein